MDADRMADAILRAETAALWAAVATLPTEQRAIVVTSRGPFDLRTMVRGTDPCPER